VVIFISYIIQVFGGGVFFERAGLSQQNDS